MAKENWKYIDTMTMNFHDSKTWKLIQSGDCAGVFQLASSGMVEICLRMKPNCIEDLVAIVALYRPDTMPELEHFIRRKLGEEEITYLHPDLEPILKSTYGCPIYQEHFMQIAQVFAGYSDGEQDKLRKGLAKKKPELVRAEAEKFRLRCIQKGYPEDVANQLADMLAEKGGYGFNKGHASIYAVNAYRTAWLKANHPIQFMCASLNNQKKPQGQTDFDQLSVFIGECMKMGIKIKNPNINLAESKFIVNGEEILYGLELIKNIGKNPVAELKKLRPFNSFEDYLERTESVSEITKTVTIYLIKAGAFDFTGKARADLLYQFCDYRFKNQLDDIKPIKNINKNHIEKLLQAKVITAKQSVNREYCLDVWNDWREKLHRQEWENDYMSGDEFTWEYESLSYHLLGDPFEGITLPDWNSFKDGDGKAKVGGTVIWVEKKKIKKGKFAGATMAFVGLNTPQGIVEATVFSEEWERFQSVLDKGAMVVVRGLKQGDGKLVLNGVKTLARYKETECK